jgi:hypothetical protein
VTARMQPEVVHAHDPLASIDGVTNGVVYQASPIGEVTITGPWRRTASRRPRGCSATSSRSQDGRQRTRNHGRAGGREHQRPRLPAPRALIRHNQGLAAVRKTPRGRTQIGQFGRDPDRQADRLAAVQSGGDVRGCRWELTTLRVQRQVRAGTAYARRILASWSDVRRSVPGSPFRDMKSASPRAIGQR